MERVSKLHNTGIIIIVFGWVNDSFTGVEQEAVTDLVECSTSVGCIYF